MKLKNKLTILFVLGLTFALHAQLTGKQLLENAIAYHDPNGNWENFKGIFNVEMSSPNASKRKSRITINLPKAYFEVVAKRDSVTTTYVVNNAKCQMQYNGKILDSTEAKEKKMSCDRATLYKNYYTYLYGLPMKLEDLGTVLNTKVEQKTFKGKSYLVLRVTYDKTVGKDVWYFYFNPKTYAMEVYQFFKTDKNGKELPTTGEYILLSEEEHINGIKMPKKRAWYYNKDDAYLGTDVLTK